MASQVRQFTITIPAGTTQVVPFVAALDLDYVEIESIDLEVPPGPGGLMAFYLARSGQQVIPYDVGEWLRWDDVQKTWHLTDQPTGSGWEVVGYNTDVYPHDVTVRFHVSAVSASPSVSVPVPSFVTTGTPLRLVTL